MDANQQGQSQQSSGWNGFIQPVQQGGFGGFGQTQPQQVGQSQQTSQTQQPAQTQQVQPAYQAPQTVPAPQYAQPVNPQQVQPVQQQAQPMSQPIQAPVQPAMPQAQYQVPTSQQPQNVSYPQVVPNMPSVPPAQAQSGGEMDDFDDMPVTGNTSGYVFGSVWGDFSTIIKMPPHSFNFDEGKFLRLLAGSISLTKDEKWKIIQFIPKLSQTKIDQLMGILEEEQRKFQELAAEHGDHLKKLEEKHMMEWKDLEYKYEQKTKRNDDASKADEIRKNLGV